MFLANVDKQGWASAQFSKNDEKIVLFPYDVGVEAVEVEALDYKTRSTFSIFGLDVDNVSMNEAVDWVLRPKLKPEYAVFVNAHSINTMYQQNTLKKAILSARRVFADGSGIRLAAKHNGIEVRANVNGTDMLPVLCEKASQQGLKLYLLGAAPDVADKAASNLQARYPGLEIAGTQHGYFDKNGEDNDAVIDAINKSGADILLVAFGSPVQEQWLQENTHRLNVRSALAVGGLFDFFSGRIPRAPLWMRKAGIEWVWRLLQEPKAKFSRYVLGNPLFMLRLFTYVADDEQPVTNLRSDFNASSGLSKYLQRGLAVMTLLALSPLLLVITLAVKLTSRGPALYKQVRVGQHGKRFSFYKFRSMYLPEDSKYIAPQKEHSIRDGVCKKYINDPRITPIGRFIRKYSVDELPQLWNIAKGDMMIVGPRPALVEEVESYEHAMYHRFDVPPGLTGLWQVSGRADTTFDEQIAMDLDYIDQRNWLKDISIIAKTIPAVLTARGAY